VADKAFFKRIKQNLKIKSFFGTSENTVIQIWASIVTLLMLGYYKFRAKLDHRLSQIIELSQLNLLDLRNIWQFFFQNQQSTSHQIAINCRWISASYNWTAVPLFTELKLGSIPQASFTNGIH